ncbi:type II secretion system protein N [Novosphingobium sp. SL115]|uniref:type II secretion system protein N n=1 Tax=Novosphingobium sp. SL115 TaxID=2995150 RepID=UPI002272AC52|nr:type II secretion system protein N [Novosphingobium sp. SL115]MCY1669702.1 type II secretion system protein N [Novosphingobium sp. SL115]
MIGRFIFVRDKALGRRGKLVLAGLLLLALIVLLPLRLVLGWIAPAAVTARSVEGAVWSGRIADLRVGPLPVGTVSAGLDVLPLMIGRGQLSVERAGPAPFAGKAYAGVGGTGLSSVSGVLPLPDGLGDLPITSLGFDGFSMRFSAGQCAEVDGTVKLTLASLGPLLPDAIALSGKARCENGKLVVPMRSAGGMETLTLRVGGDGRWQADLALSGLPPEVSAPLLQSGFAARPGGIGIGTSGVF